MADFPHIPAFKNAKTRRKELDMRLCAFADEASVDLNGQIDALKRNNISLLEIRGEMVKTSRKFLMIK